MISNECSLRIVPPSHCPGHFGGSHPTRGRQAGQLQPTMLRLVDCEPFARRLHQTAAAFSSGVPSNPPQVTSNIHLIFHLYLIYYTSSIPIRPP